MILILFAVLEVIISIEYPIVFTTVRYINLQSSTILKDIGVTANETAYNIISLDGWSPNKLTGPAQFWTHPSKYLPNSQYGKTDREIQLNLKQSYIQKKKKLFMHVSDGINLLSSNTDPLDIATKISKFVIQNLFDGVCIQILQRSQLANLQKSQWIIEFTRSLKNQLSGKIICYQQFPTDFVKGMVFNQIAKEISRLIDFFIIKYYNFQLPDYSNYSSIFINSSLYPGSTIKDLLSIGILPNQLVVGKTSSKLDGYTDNFFITSDVLSASFVQAFNQLGWYSGYASNYYYYDLNGTYAKGTTTLLKQLCDMSETCR